MQFGTVSINPITNAEYLMAVKVTKVKSALALYQKFIVTRCTVCVEIFILVSKSEHKAPFWPYAALLIKYNTMQYNIF